MSLNLGALVQTAMAAVPSSAKARVTFTKTTTAYDSSTDTKGPSTTITVTGTASQDTGDRDAYVALGLVSESARTLIFVPDTIGQFPALGMSVVWGSVTYTVKSVDPIAPGGASLASSVIVGA